jgi:hypothetical protein
VLLLFTFLHYAHERAAEASAIENNGVKVRGRWSRPVARKFVGIKLKLCYSASVCTVMIELN